MPLPHDVSLRPMTVADVPAGLALCRASGWNQVERDWRRFLEASPGGAAVAVRGGRVVGSVATLPYESAFTWISMVLVDPAARGGGIGTALLEHGLSLVAPAVTPRLDATPAGEAVYRPRGFVGERPLTRWRIEAAAGLAAPAGAARPLEPRDWSAVHALDREAFGASRREHLLWLAEGAPGYAWVVERDGSVEAWLLGRHGHNRDQLGPLVSRDRRAAEALLCACLAAHPGRAFYLDAPDGDPSWQARLTALGGRTERPFLRMHRGVLARPGRPEWLYAIAGPEFG